MTTPAEFGLAAGTVYYAVAPSGYSYSAEQDAQYGARKYTTLAAAVAALPGTTFTAPQAINIIGSWPAADSISAGLVLPAALATASNPLHVRAIGVARCRVIDAPATTGIYSLSLSTNSGKVITLGDYTTLSGIKVRLASTPLATSVCVQVDGSNSLVEGCVLRNMGSSSYLMTGVDLAVGAVNSGVRNCLAYATYSSSVGFRLRNISHRVTNCGAWGSNAANGTGFLAAAGVAALIRNCYTQRFPSGGWSAPDATGSNNAADTGQTPIGNSPSVGTAAVVNYASTDLRLLPGDAVCWGLGVDLSAEFADDMDLRTRTRWSIGPDEGFQGAGGPESTAVIEVPTGIGLTVTAGAGGPASAAEMSAYLGADCLVAATAGGPSAAAEMTAPPDLVCTATAGGPGAAAEVQRGARGHHPKIRSIRRYLRAIPPAWWLMGEGLALVDVIADWLDEEIRSWREALDSRFPGAAVDSPEILARHGRERMLQRGRSETGESYAARLLAWLPTHGIRGSADGIARQLATYWASTAVVVDRTGNRTTVDAAGSLTRTTGGLGWDDGPSTDWARFWCLLDGQTPGVLDQLPIDDPDLWPSPTSLVGMRGATAADVAATRALFQHSRETRAWQATGTQPEWLVISLDGSLPSTVAWETPGAEIDGVWQLQPAMVHEGLLFVSLDPAHNNTTAGDPTAYPVTYLMIDGTEYTGDADSMPTDPWTMLDGSSYEGDPDLYPVAFELCDDGTLLV